MKLSEALLKRLKALPKDKQRLTQGRMTDDMGNHCALGWLGYDNDNQSLKVYYPDGWDGETVHRKLQHDFSILGTNEDFKGTPEERYTHVVKALENHLGQQEGENN